MPVNVRNMFPYIINRWGERYLTDETVYIHDIADSDGSGSACTGEPDGL